MFTEFTHNSFIWKRYTQYKAEMTDAEIAELEAAARIFMVNIQIEYPNI